MMKKITAAFLLITSIAFSQNYQTVEEVNNACSTLGFTTNEDAEIAVDEIMEVIGLQKNFTLQECPNINNAVAKNITDESGNIKRYILYDNEFFSKMDIKAGSDWAAISILAHEIGHHLNGHSLNNEGSNHEFELDADYFSGLILSKMGATLEETQSAINTFRYEKATATHPAKIDRLNEIERGWAIGSNYKNKTDVTDYPDDMEPVVQELYIKAKNGDATAQNNLGWSYHRGNGVNKDYNEALKWYRKAAEQGHDLAQTSLGYMYKNGLGVNKDYNEALKWYLKAAKQGNTIAENNIGLMYDNGFGVNKDHYEAVKWYRKAAEKGNATAQFNLGGSYEKGVGATKNYNEAIKWYRKAIEKDEANAMSNLGAMYFLGKGVNKDYREALKLFRNSAKQGDISGLNNLGFMYENGFGVDKNYSEAVKWYQKAARLGNKSSQEQLKKLGESW